MKRKVSSDDDITIVNKATTALVTAYKKELTRPAKRTRAVCADTDCQVNSAYCDEGKFNFFACSLQDGWVTAFLKEIKDLEDNETSQVLSNGWGFTI